MNLRCRCPKGCKKGFLEKASFPSDKLVKIKNPENQRKWIQDDYNSISKLLVWDIWPFSLNGELRPPYCSFLFSVPSTKLEDYLRCVKIMFWTKTASWTFLRDAGTCPTWSTERPWRWLKKPWSETSPSSPGKRSSELLEIFPQKVHGDDGRLGCFFGWWAFGLFLMIYIRPLGFV